uniref:Polycystin-1-like protein 1 n=1 Tax=Pipistrellus kuhlii TaxID=59472 RepID=A0A7J7TPF2_PIPKU|nr:polycystin 1 like 1, transient receptor potential channel interacting [Pipistrellus kuhlii]
MAPERRLLVPALALLCLLPPGPGSRAEEGDGHRRGDRPPAGKTAVPTAQEPAPGAPGDQERGPQEPSVETAGCGSGGGQGCRLRPTCATGESSGAFWELVQCTCPAGPCSLQVEVPSCAVGPLRSAEDLAPGLLPGKDATSATVTPGAPIKAATSAQTSIPTSPSAVLPRSPHRLPPGPPCTLSLSTPRPGHQQLWPHAQCLATAVPALGLEDAADPVAHRFPHADAQALPGLGFRVQITPEAALCLVMDFGDGSGVQMRTHRATGDVAVTTFHQYRREGVYALQAVLHSESHGAEVRLGPYYVELGPEAPSVFLNASSVLGDHVLSFGGSPPDLRSTIVSHHFPPISSCNVSFALQTCVGGRWAWSSMAVRYRMQPVSVYTNGTVFATDTDITFVAVTKETTPLEFTWFFGEDLPVRTRRRSIQRRLGAPQWYRVVVQASNGMGSVASEPHHVQAQRRVVASGLVATASALVNAPVTFQCRISFGTDVAYRWAFGDGAGGLGSSSTSHVYSREGEFTVEVVAFNAVSTVSLRKRLFVVRRPCQPPPVKNMGPGKVQVWRSQPVTLGVTFEAAILCDISQGLSYAWSLTDSEGWPVPLPPAVSTHRQTLTVPHYFLEPGNYTALAQVQVRGSPVHSNYCVGVEVRARAPVSVISEGTHLFIPRTPSSTMVLSGSLSYDPDRPGATLRYHWACTPASAPGRPCFAGPAARSLDVRAPTLSFAVDSLSSGYDQFLVTLTVSSHGRNSSEAQVFLSTLPDVALRRVHISGGTFRGVPVNWNEELLLRAACEDCGEAALSFSWDLFVVNATGRGKEEDFEAYYSDVQEAVPSGGRQPAAWTSMHLSASGPGANEDESRGDGDNLVGPFLPTASAPPALLVDWPKSPVSRAVFQGLTASGITGQTVTVKPFSLSPGETYVLQAAVASGHSFLGKAQLYVTVNRAPRDVACQVQPHRGLEADTIFSVFCTSGRPDFRYEFGYRIGNASKYTLYRGTDAQHYFALPAGEPMDGYQVLVSTVITDGDGSQTQPCAVAVTVLPRLHGDRCPGEDVYNASLRNLSTLQQMGSDTQVRNYVAVTTTALSRWAREGGSPSCGQWSRLQDAFIPSVCSLAPQDQEEAAGSVLLLRDLLRFPNKVSLASALLVLRCARTLRAPSQHPAGCVVGAGRVRELVLLVSRVLEATDHGHSSSGRLLEEGAQAIADALLGCLSCSERQAHVSAGQAEVHTQLHCRPQSSVQSLGPVRVRLPADLAGRKPSPCYVSQLLLLRTNPFLQGRTTGQVGALLALSLHCCSSRRPLHRPRLRTPVTVEFGEEDGPADRGNETFVLLRERVNVHRFAGLSAASPESLQIRVQFSPPAARALPVMLLVRFSEEPTPADFLLRQLHLREGLTAHVSVPAAMLQGHTHGYLSLLDADYDREPPNAYLAEAVSYAVRFQGVRCLLWDPRPEPERLPAQPAAPPGKVTCSYDLLGAYSVARRSLNASFESRDVSQFRRCPENLLPSIFIVAITVLYALLVTKSRRVDRREKKKTGHIFLHDSAPPSHQLYAVVVDTGFRAPARFTAKVYIVLCGEDGRSEPRELCCPEKPLFERNSRHTFVLSTPATLGPLRKVRLWHDSGGAHPAWYVSHVMVKELPEGRGRWFFPAECWLAAGRRDGRVERELACLRGGLGFRKLLLSRFTERLEDLHVWASVHSRPAGRGLPHTPRLSVAFALLCAYACLAALVTATGHKQLPLSVGPAGVPLGCFWTGFLCTLLASPGAQLLSLLFRLSQQRAPAVLCGGAQTQSAVSGEGATQTPPELEACRAELGQRAPREKRDCILGLQAPSSAFRGLVTTPWPRAPRPWLRYAAWAICGTVSVACGVGTVHLGYRFSPMQCGQWLCLLTVSVTCCVFVTQPLMVGLLALGFAWRRRDDESFFTESLQEATEGLAGLSPTHAPHTPCSSDPRGPGGVERVLAERQRARRLRRAHPPTTAWLRATRERMRRQTRTGAMLRDTCMSVLMLLLHLLITHATSSRDEHSLNHAIRSTFTRGARSFSGSLSSVDAWWDWSLTTLLDGLYRVGVPGAQPGALGGTCYLIGPAVLKQLKLSPGPSCEPLRPRSVLPEDSLPMCHPAVGGSEAPSVTNAETQRAALSAPTACRELCELSLGRTRSAARAVLSGLRAGRWVDQHTRAVSMHFVLYNPPTRLFSSVSLRAELLPSGGLTPSLLVESVPVFHRDAAPRYHLLIPQLAFLVLTLTHLCLQLFRLAEEGIRGYWQKPGTWLELPIAGAILAWYAASGHLLSLAGEVADQFHMGFLQGFVDLSPMASWNQRARWLQGTLSFLLTLRCLRLLGSHRAVVSCTSATRRSLQRVIAPGLAGVLVLAAHTHLRGMLLFTVAPPSGTFADASHRFPGSSLRDTLLGLSQSAGRAPAACCTALLAAVTALWIAMLRGSRMAFVPKRKSSQSQSLVSLGDVMAYVRGACSALGLARRPPEEAEPATSQTTSLEEFADLLDELLLKIDRLSAPLPFPLPAQPPWDALRAGARAEGSPSEGASGDQAAGPSGIENPLRPGLC